MTWRIVCFGALLSLSTAALADEQAIMGQEDLDRADLRVVKSDTKVYFHKGYDPGCPALTAACRTKAFILSGDQVITYGRKGALTEVEYVSAKGVPTRGWVASAALSPIQTVIPAWAGNWMRTEANIRIAPTQRPGQYLATGDATWGAGDPGRVKRGAVNIGEFSAVFTPDSLSAGFATGEADKEGGTSFTLPDGSIAKSFAQNAPGDYRCRVAMKRVGPYLLVADNMQCGGMNVSFTGTYVRKSVAAVPPAKPIRAR